MIPLGIISIAIRSTLIWSMDYFDPENSEGRCEKQTQVTKKRGVRGEAFACRVNTRGLLAWLQGRAVYNDQAPLYRKRINKMAAVIIYVFFFVGRRILPRRFHYSREGPCVFRVHRMDFIVICALSSHYLIRTRVLALTFLWRVSVKNDGEWISWISPSAEWLFWVSPLSILLLVYISILSFFCPPSIY